MIKKLDAVIGFLAASIIPAPNRQEFSPPLSSILIIRPGGIGDAVLLASAINSLNNSHPNIHITILAEQRNAGTFSLIPGVDEVFCYDNPREFIKAVRGHYDVVIDTEQWHRLSAVIARLVRASIKIGFGTNQRLRMFTHVIDYEQAVYEPDNFFALLKPLGVDFEGNAGVVTLSLPLQSISRANQLLQPLCNAPFIVIFPGSSIEEKRWGAERFSLVAKRLSKEGYKVVVVGGREDREDGDMIVGKAGLNLAGMTSLSETAAVIDRSFLVISGDSGVLHLAAGLDIPTVSLFGPGSAAKWAPKGEKHVVLNHSLSCSPCTIFGTIPPCPNGARCMLEITVDEVVDASALLLNRSIANFHTSETAPPL